MDPSSHSAPSLTAPPPGPASLDAETDASLVARFASPDDAGSEHAFAALVRRHGPMVLRTCRAILRDDHAAEDALQATFLVLMRRAPALRVRDTLGPWLHEVACRVSSASRSAEARRARHERRAAEMTERHVTDRVPDDAEDLLHQEVDRLPERYRTPVVLCYLEGLTSEQAAGLLGWPVGTVRSRLARARDQLRGRLVRRGVVLSAGLLGASLAGGSIPAPLSAELVEAVVSTVLRDAGGGAVSATVLDLAREGVDLARPIPRRVIVAGIVTLGAVPVGVALGLRLTGRSLFGLRYVPRRVTTAVLPAAFPSAPKRGIWSLALAGDGRRLVTGHDESLRIWDLASRRQLDRVDRPCREVRRVGITPDGRTIVSAENSCDRATDDRYVVAIREGGDGRLRRTLLGHDDAVNCVAISPDGALVASVDENDCEIQLWDAATGRPSGALACHERTVNAVVFSNDGKTLASCGRDQKVRLWDVATRSQRLVLRGHRGAVESVAFSPDGTLIASGGFDRTVRVWDLADGSPRLVLAIPCFGLAVAFRPDGRALAATSGDWGDGRHARARCDLIFCELDRPGEAVVVAAGPAQILGLAFTPDGRSLVTGSRDGSIRVWDTDALARL